MATSTHLPPPVMMESTELLRWVTHMLCWTCAMYFSAAAFSENDQGSINLASNTACMPSTIPSRVAGCKARHSSASTGPYKDNGPSPPSLVLLMLIVAFFVLFRRPERSPSD